VSDFLQLQIDAGVDALQIFDSLGGVLSDGNFMAASDVGSTNCNGARESSADDPVLEGDPWQLVGPGRHGSERSGMDSNVRLSETCVLLPENLAVQGNLDPFLLGTRPDLVEAETRRIIAENERKARAHIQPRAWSASQLRRLRISRVG
jgi:uroporphyrinogen decarboxylase